MDIQFNSLKDRRVRGDLIQTYNFFNKVDDINKACFFDFPLTDITRNSTDKIQKQHHKNNTRKFTFSYRITNQWNKLTLTTKRAPNVNTFKNFIDKHRTFTNIMYDFDGQR